MLKVQHNRISDYLQQSFLTQLKLILRLREVAWYCLIALIIGLGIYLRVKQYSFNRALWLDEAFLATQIARGEWISFFAMPMEYSHIVPPFFLVLCRIGVVVLGDSDLALRVYPLATGITSTVLFYQLARKIIEPWALVWALVLFCTSQELVFYASDLKPYSSDVMFALLILLGVLSVPAPDCLTYNRKLGCFTIMGIISLWFSHASIMLLASAGVYLSYSYCRQKQWRALLKLVLSGVCWLGIFAFIYFVVNGGDPHKASPIADWLYIFWHQEHGFIPHSLNAGLAWLGEVTLHFLKDPLGLRNQKVAAILVLVGVASLLKKNRLLLLLLVLPVFWTLTATYFEKYAFSGRLVLFLTPIACLLIGIGIAQLNPVSLFKSLNESQQQFLSGIFFILQCYLCIILLRMPFRVGHEIEEIKPALHYLQQHIQKTDKVYVYKWAEPAARYYAPFYGFNFLNCHTLVPISQKAGDFKEVDFFRQTRPNLIVDKVSNTFCVLGQAEGFDNSVAELSLLQNSGKMWFLFTHISTKDEAKFIRFLDAMGKRVDEQHYPAVALYLYQL